MDNRLFRIDGRRLARLRQEDLPTLARAIIAVIRGRARAGRVRVKNIDYIELQGPNTDSLIIRSDWDKILPLVQQEVFNTQITPAEPPGRYLDHKVAYGEPILDHADRQLHDRIVGALHALFTETYPTRPY